MTSVQKAMDTHRQQNKSRLLEFDVLRAVAIILLLLHHGGIYNFSILGFSLGNLDHYVQLFLLGSFVFLSGYLFAVSYEKNGPKQFWLGRLVRMLIPYWIALLLFLWIMGIEAGPQDILIHILGGQMVLSPRLTKPILTIWFVGLTLAYYVIFGFLMGVYRKPTGCIVATLLVFAGAVFLRMEFGLVARRFLYYFFIFAAGVWMARKDWLEKLTTARFFLVDKLLFAALGAAALYPFQDQVGNAVSLPLILVIDLFILSAILLALSVIHLAARRSLSLRFFSAISYASFFTYLLHRPVWELMSKIYYPQSLQQASLYLMLIGFGMVLPLAYYLQRYYDKASRWITQNVFSV